MVNRRTTEWLAAQRGLANPLAMLVAYDYSLSRAANETGIDAILAGDSAGMVAMGLQTTAPVSLEDMIRISGAVRRGAPDTFVIGDMPFGTYEICGEEAARSAVALVKNAGVDAVKLEGGKRVASRIQAIVDCNISVMGHLGLTPQTASGTTGYRPYGRTETQIADLHRDMTAVQDAGAFSILLEGIPGELTSIARSWVEIPVYGIGAGKHVDGQLLLAYDLLGLFPDFRPKFARNFVADLPSDGDPLSFYTLAVRAFQQYKDAVKDQTFPAPSETYELASGSQHLVSFAASIGKESGQ